jgi:hypothetical protein
MRRIASWSWSVVTRIAWPLRYVACALSASYARLPPLAPAQSLQSCLLANQTAELLSGPNQYRCAVCKADRDTEKTLKVWRLPETPLWQVRSREPQQQELELLPWVQS